MPNIESERWAAPGGSGWGLLAPSLTLLIRLVHHLKLRVKPQEPSDRPHPSSLLCGDLCWGPRAPLFLAQPIRICSIAQNMLLVPSNSSICTARQGTPWLLPLPWDTSATQGLGPNCTNSLEGGPEVWTLTHCDNNRQKREMRVAPDNVPTQFFAVPHNFFTVPDSVGVNAWPWADRHPPRHSPWCFYKKMFSFPTLTMSLLSRRCTENIAYTLAINFNCGFTE